MAGNERRRRARSESVALDVMHIVIGIIVVILAAVSFVNPEEYLFFFPIIFFLAAILNLVTGKYRMGKSGRNKRRKMAAALQMLFGAALLALTGISAVSIWWR